MKQKNAPKKQVNRWDAWLKKMALSLRKKKKTKNNKKK